MRILFLSFHYQPDLSAGSFRNTALVKALFKQLPEGSQIDVMTTLPNRYASFSVEAPELEVTEGLTVERITIPAHKSGMLDQSKAFLTYAHGVMKRTKNKEYDLVYASSSRLMTAALGALIARSKKLPLYLDIRDIFVDTIKDVLSKKLVWAMKPIFSLLERWAVMRAQKVNLVSGGFRNYFEQRYSEKHFTYFTNGIDQQFIQAQPKEAYDSNSILTKVVYAGNFGEGQGLHLIIPQLAKELEGCAEFLLLGDGGRKVQLEKALSEQQVINVELKAPVGREELISIYQQADVLFLHLNDYDAFLKVLPSKIFEYGALGKPVWAGVAGFSALFLRDNVSNSVVFQPCNLSEALISFKQLKLRTEPRFEFVKNFSRDNIIQQMAADIISTKQ